MRVYLSRFNRKTVVKIYVTNRMVNIICRSLDNKGREVHFRRFSNYWLALPVSLIRQQWARHSARCWDDRVEEDRARWDRWTGDQANISEKEALGKQAPRELCARSPSGVSLSLEAAVPWERRRKELPRPGEGGGPCSGRFHRRGAISHGLWKGNKIQASGYKNGHCRQRD